MKTANEILDFILSDHPVLLKLLELQKWEIEIRQDQSTKDHEKALKLIHETFNQKS